MSFGGFLEFSAPTLVYRLQAEANQVRVRYPADVSMTFTARLALNGTPDSSTVPQAGAAAVGLRVLSTVPLPSAATHSDSLSRASRICVGLAVLC